jgi:hypothetical protein
MFAHEDQMVYQHYNETESPSPNAHQRYPMDTGRGSLSSY